MTVERAEAWEVVVPCHPGTINSPELGNFLGHEWDLLPICLLRLTLSDGTQGLGEVDRGHSLCALRGLLAELPGLSVAGPNAAFPADWRGRTLFDGAIEEAHTPGLWSTRNPLKPAVEMALLDASGRRLGCRVVDLLGGAYREEVPVDAWCGRQTPAALREIVGRAVSRGFRGLKMKSRLGDPVVEQVRAIREAAGPEFGVTIDPMYQWMGPAETLPLLRRLEEFGPGIRVEDPFPEDRPEFWRRARHTCAVPLAWHARTLASLRRGLQEGCADAYNCSGGAFEFLTLAHAVEVAGYSLWRGSSLELGVGQAAGLHAAAAARACVMASDFQSGLMRQHTLVDWDWPYSAGRLPLPAGPGIGVQFDMDAVNHYAREQVRIPE